MEDTDGLVTGVQKEWALQMNRKQPPAVGGSAGKADQDKLALDGGTPVRSEPLPPCLPGGMAIGEEEKAEVLQVLETKSLYRNQGPQVLGKVQDFERAFAQRVGKKHALAVSCGATYQGKSIGSFGHLNAFNLQYAKVITSGEGGVVVTGDDALFERAVRAHDHGVIRPPSGQILGVYQDEAFLAENYRMGELAGAVAGAQLRKLDGLLATLRRLKKRVKDAISDIEEFEFRQIPAADEEVGFTLVFYLARREKAVRFVEALDAENVGAYQLCDGDPLYAYPQVLNQRTQTAEGCPFKCPLASRQIEYKMGMCPKTEELMRRSVWIPISTLLTDKDADDIIRAIHKVNRALA